MEGISHEACALAGAWKLEQADRALRRQRHLDRRRGRALVRRRHAEALRGLRLERDRRRRRPRRRRGRRRDRRRRAQRPTGRRSICCKTTIGKGSPNRGGTAKAHGEALGADEVKLTRAALGWAHEPFVAARGGLRALGRASARGARPRRRGRRLRRLRGRAPRARRRVHRGAWRGELPTDCAQTVRAAAVAAHAKAETVATRKASQIALEAFTEGAARAARRQRRPDRLEPHQHQHTPPLRFDADGAPARDAERRARPAHQLRRARVRHGRGDERRRAARRLHPLRRHLPHLQRLQPQRDPHGRADEAARRSTSSRTTRSASARTGRRTRPSSTRRRCA